MNTLVKPHNSSCVHCIDKAFREAANRKIDAKKSGDIVSYRVKPFVTETFDNIVTIPCLRHSH